MNIFNINKNSFWNCRLQDSVFADFFHFVNFLLIEQKPGEERANCNWMQIYLQDVFKIYI